MGRGFNVARVPSGTAPNTLVVSPTAGQTFLRGALVKLDSNGTLVECSADPTSILGIAGSAAFKGVGQNVPDTSQVTGLSEKNSGVPVMLLDRETVYSCRGVNGGTDPVTPTLAHRGVLYGVAKVGNDWVLDISETTTTSFKVVDFDAQNKIFFVKPKDSVLNVP